MPEGIERVVRDAVHVSRRGRRQWSDHPSSPRVASSPATTCARCAPVAPRRGRSPTSLPLRQQCSRCLQARRDMAHRTIPIGRGTEGPGPSCPNNSQYSSFLSTVSVADRSCPVRRRRRENGPFSGPVFLRMLPKMLPSTQERLHIKRETRWLIERRRPESNRRIAVLQTAALPLGYGAVRTLKLLARSGVLKGTRGSSSLTLTFAVPLTPSLVAVTVASPLFCAVTTPESVHRRHLHVRARPGHRHAPSAHSRAHREGPRQRTRALTIAVTQVERRWLTVTAPPGPAAR